MPTMTYTQAVDHLNKWLALPIADPAQPDGMAVKLVLERARQLESAAFTEPFRYLRAWTELPSRKRERLSTTVVLDALRVHGRTLAAQHAAESDVFDADQEVGDARRDQYAARQRALYWKMSFLGALAVLVVVVGGVAMYLASTL